jgi:hypothetical protein
MIRLVWCGIAMNLVSIGRPKIAWYEEQKSATSNVRYSVRKFSYVPNVTGRHTRPMGYAALPGTTPVEGFITSGHLAEVEFHLAQRFCEDDV